MQPCTVVSYYTHHIMGGVQRNGGGGGGGRRETKVDGSKTEMAHRVARISYQVLLDLLIVGILVQYVVAGSR